MISFKILFPSIFSMLQCFLAMWICKPFSQLLRKSHKRQGKVFLSFLNWSITFTFLIYNNFIIFYSYFIFHLVFASSGVSVWPFPSSISSAVTSLSEASQQLSSQQQAYLGDTVLRDHFCSFLRHLGVDLLDTGYGDHGPVLVAAEEMDEGNGQTETPENANEPEEASIA